MEENSSTPQIDIKEFKNPDVDSSKNEIVNTIKELVPAKVFIVPYRDREPHKLVFTRVMPYILGDSNYRILFIHQKDKRPFNRGGIKNIGFHYVKKKWPNHWQNITLIFHDIDFMAYRKGQFSFDTKHGQINHFYGYPHTLGGIFAIKGIDFEKTAGFPNIWTWGLEDNVLLERVLALKFKVIRNEFVHAQTETKNIISLWHGWDRLLNPNTGLQKMHYQVDSLWTILNMNWYEEQIEDKIWMIHVTSFDVPITDKNPIVQNARVTNSRINRNFKSWRGLEYRNKSIMQQQQQRLKQGKGGLLVKWGRK
tara:strand:- start:193 stop:1119 length:927 start_codon:yes stop_codon:yes gene_type:complete